MEPLPCIATVRVPDRLDDVLEVDSIANDSAMLELFGRSGTTIAIYAQGGWLSVHLKPNPAWKPKIPAEFQQQ